MSFNKVNGKLDFRNIKMTQFDASQTARMEFSELHSAKRVLPTNAIIKDGFTHFRQQLDASNRPTQVDYYQALDSTIDKITFRADVAGDLAGTYYLLTNSIDGKTYAIYQVASGSGSAPGVADVEIAATFDNNDSATVVALANKQALANITDITIKYYGILTNYVDVEYQQFGTTDAIDLGTTGFTVTRTKTGENYLVTTVELAYDTDGNIIWQDELLKGATFDPFRGQFNFPQKVQITDGIVGNTISTLNSRPLSTLAAGATFQGVGEDVSQYGRVGIAIRSDNFTDGVLTIEVSQDNINWGGPSRDWTNTKFGQPHMWNIVEKYFRILYTNGTTEAENLGIQVHYSVNADTLLGHQLNETLIDETEAIVVRSVAVGTSPDGTYQNSPLGGKDTQNSTTTNLGAAGTFIGEYQNLAGYSSGLFFAISTSPLAEIKLQYSPDGVNPTTGILATSDLTTTVQETGGFYIYLTVISTFIDSYYRMEVTNGATPTAVLEVDSWLYDKPYTGSFGGLEDDLTNFSIAQLTRSVNAGVDAAGVFRNIKVDGYVPDLASDTPLLAGATYDSGIVDLTGYNYVASELLSDVSGSLTVYFYDDAAGTTELRQFTRPFVAGDTFAIFGSILTRPYYRYVYTNGAVDQTQFHIATKVTNQALSGQILGLEDFIPNNIIVPVTRSVGTGTNPDGVITNNRVTGVLSNNSSQTPLLANTDFQGTWTATQGFEAISVSATTDAVSGTNGIYVEFADDDIGTNSVRARRETYSTGNLNNLAYYTWHSNLREYFRVVWENSTTDQTVFNLESVLHTGVTEQTKSPMVGSISNNTPTVATKSATMQIDENNQYLITGSKGALTTSLGVELGSSNVHITQTDGDQQIRPTTARQVGQLNVTSASAVKIPNPDPTKISVARSLAITNSDDTNTVFQGSDSGVTTTNGYHILPLASTEDDIGDDIVGGKDVPETWLIAGGAVATEQTNSLAPDTTDSSSGVTSPGNVFSSDDTRALFTTNTSTATYSGFDAAGASLLTDITDIKIVCEMRKEPSAGNEVATWEDTVGQDAGNVTTITSPTVTANVNHFYLVAISRRDEFSDVDSISNTMGFTGATLISDTAAKSAEARTTVYRMTGTPTTGDGTITANFSQAADHCIISITRFSGIDLTSPIDSSHNNGQNSGVTYSGTLGTSSNNGCFYLAIGMEQITHTATLNPSGSTERFEDGSTAGNDQTQAIVTAPISTGGFSYNGTVSGSSDSAWVALALKPSAALDPEVTISHSEGATVLNQIVSSETDASYEASIFGDTTWDTATIDAMTLTALIDDLGVADLQIDRLYIEVTSSSSTVRISYKWVGDAP